MKLPLWLLALCLISLIARAEDPSAKGKEVTKLDGTKLFGIVEVTDDYTIRVSNDSGIMKIPLALLGESDFKKYGFQKDRSKDGRFWSERQQALETEKDSGSESKSSNSDNPLFELKLKEIAVFQPLIDAYEKTVSDKKSKDAETAKSNQPKTPDEPVRALFSSPGMTGPLPQAFTGMANGNPAAPAAAAGTGLLAPISGAASALPVAP